MFLICPKFDHNFSFSTNPIINTDIDTKILHFWTSLFQCHLSFVNVNLITDVNVLFVSDEVGVRKTWITLEKKDSETTKSVDISVYNRVCQKKKLGPNFEQVKNRWILFLKILIRRENRIHVQSFRTTFTSNFILFFLFNCSNLVEYS